MLESGNKPMKRSILPGEINTMKRYDFRVYCINVATNTTKEAIDICTPFSYQAGLSKFELITLILFHQGFVWKVSTNECT